MNFGGLGLSFAGKDDGMQDLVRDLSTDVGHLRSSFADLVKPLSAATSALASPLTRALTSASHGFASMGEEGSRTSTTLGMLTRAVDSLDKILDVERVRAWEIGRAHV